MMLNRILNVAYMFLSVLGFFWHFWKSLLAALVAVATVAYINFGHILFTILPVKKFL